MMSYLEKEFNGTKPKVTFCITASLLDKHLNFIKQFKNGHEFAAHGFFHTNLKMKNRDEQIEIIRRSFENFEKYGMPVRGFRCPYLSYNTHTIDALVSSPYVWTSNNVIRWEKNIGTDKHSRNHLKKLGHIYKILDASSSVSVPRFIDRLIDIPITAPDDEMIYERLRIKNNSDITNIWRRIFKDIHERGELFHLLFHPERFRYIRSSIKETLEETGKNRAKVWVAGLNEISEWWLMRSRSKWALQKKAGISSIKISAPASSTILVKSNNDGSGPYFFKTYRIAAIDWTAENEIIFESDNPSKHMINISEKASESLEHFLVNEGFFVQRAKNEVKETLFIRGFEIFREEDKLPLLESIDNSTFPLLRLWRWPDGAASAFTISSDVDSINFGDFVRRLLNF